MLSAAEFDRIHGDPPGRWIRAWVTRHAGIVLEDGKEYLVETRLAPVLQRHGFTALAELAQRLPHDRRVQQDVVDALTTNETSFFRDHTPFQALRTVVFPAVAKTGARTVRVWSAACSTGQEAASVAMILRDEFPELCPAARVVGTDISKAAVDKAQQGRYTQLEVNRGLPAPLLVRHFQRVGTEWQLGPHVRGMTEFRVQNLLEPWLLGGPFDVVLLRNVMIYFDLDTRAKLLARIHAAMHPKGWLMVGASEAGIVGSHRFVGETHGSVSLFRPG